MANTDERQLPATLRPPSGFSPLQCWRCKSTVPYEYLRRRVVNTSASRGVYEVSKGFVSVLNRYEIVNLCSACADALTAEKQALVDTRGRLEAWWGRLGLGMCFVGMLLFVRQPPLLILALTWLLDRLRVLGVAVLLMIGVFLAEYLIGLQPFRYHRRIRIPWFVVINGVILWGIWRTNLLQKASAWLLGKRSSALRGSLQEIQFFPSSENRDPSQ